MTDARFSRLFPAVDLGLLRRLAEELAFTVRAGDTLALHGDLGAGKTTFSRLFIQAAVPDVAEVPSPTFTLVQGYRGPRYDVAHFDLYRLRDPAELDELGFDDVLAGGVALVEWPERAGDRLPDERLDVVLGDCHAADVPAGAEASSLRRMELIGHGGWAARLARLCDIHDFLVGAGGAAGPEGDTRDVWGRFAYMQGDASTRRYAVVWPPAPSTGPCGERTADEVRPPAPSAGPPLNPLADAKARQWRHGAAAPRVLMDSPRQPDGPPVRDGLPYSRIAHLAEDVRPFVAIDTALAEAGFSVPRILAHDLERGFLLLEHLGDDVFGALLAKAGGETAAPLQAMLWRAGVECLAELARVPVPAAMPLPDGTTYSLPPYDARALGIETELIVDWYWPAVHGGAAVPAEARAEFLALWGDIIARLVALPAGWALRDYHSPNLLWLPERQGAARVGIIDFQDAQAGPLAYDVVSLLQDARLDVPAELETELLSHYCALRRAAEPTFDEPAFRFAYAALGAQRNTKIVGIFARLSRRDGKHGYLAHMPRIWRYLARDLAHPELAALRAWYDRHLPVDIRARVLSP